MPIKRGASKLTPPYTAFTSTRPKYGIGGKPTGKRANYLAATGAGMKNKVRRAHQQHKQPKRYSGAFDKSAFSKLSAYIKGK